jgi:hypothetical protein
MALVIAYSKSLFKGAALSLANAAGVPIARDPCDQETDNQRGRGSMNREIVKSGQEYGKPSEAYRPLPALGQTYWTVNCIVA